jgi:hypothetical protein
MDEACRLIGMFVVVGLWVGICAIIVFWIDQGRKAMNKVEDLRGEFKNMTGQFLEQLEWIKQDAEEFSSRVEKHIKGGRK